jgi:hypothetical protein
MARRSCLPDEEEPTDAIGNDRPWPDGRNMVRRLIRGGHECVAFDMSPESLKNLAAVAQPESCVLLAYVRRKRFRFPR